MAVRFIHNVMCIGKGKITVSTSGISPAIPDLADLGVQLAISLHAPNDDLRSYIMPINKTYNLKSLIEACKLFVERSKCTGKRITFEYVMLDGVNDSLVLASEFAKLIKGIPSHINLIPFNKWPGAPYRCSPKSRIKAFGKILTGNFNIPTTIRWSRGQGI